MVGYIISIDSSLSMGLGLNGKPLASNEDNSRYRVAVDLVKRIVAKVEKTYADFMPNIVLYRHGHVVEKVWDKVTTADDVIKAYLTSYDTFGASHHGTLIQTIYEAEKPCHFDKLLVLTDASSFDGDMNFFTPCEARFVIMNTDPATMDSMQMEELEEISAQSIGLEIQDKSLNFCHQFLYDGDTERLAGEIVEELFDDPEFTINCGQLNTRVKLLPPLDIPMGENMEIFGFAKQTSLQKFPIKSRHYLLGMITPSDESEVDASEDSMDIPDKEGQEHFLQLLYEGLSVDQMAGLVRFNDSADSRIGFVMPFVGVNNDRCVLLCVFPPSWEMPSYAPDFAKLVLATNSSAVDSDALETTAKTAGPTPSYSPNFEYVCWNSEGSMNNDLQKVIRLMKKLPDRPLPFYAEVNKIRRYAVYTSSQEVLQCLCEVLCHEAKTASAELQEHVTWTCQHLTVALMRPKEDIVPPTTR